MHQIHYLHVKNFPFEEFRCTGLFLAITWHQTQTRYIGYN